MSETVHVAIMMGEDDEPYAWEASPGDAEDSDGIYEVDVPAEMWAQVDQSWRTIRAAFDSIREMAGIDAEHWRLTVPCAEWQGHAYPAQRWYALEIPRSDDAEVWPQLDVQTGHFDSHLEAQAFLDALPDEFVVVSHRPWVIDKSTLTITRHAYEGHAHECDRCGWPRDEHSRPPSPVDEERAND